MTRSEVKTICVIVAVILPLQVWVVVAAFKETHPNRFKLLAGNILFWLVVSIAMMVTKRFGKS